MDIEIGLKATEEIRKTPIVQQSTFWSKVKQKQGIDSSAFDIRVREDDIYEGNRNGEYITDDFLVLFQDVGYGMSIGYVPYGPTLKPDEGNQGVFLEELSETIRSYIPGNCIMLRYDLLWESPWAKDDARFRDGDWVGPPEKRNQEIRLNINTHNWNLHRSNTDVLPKDTVFVNLTKDEDTLLREMKPKTRYNIRLAGRKGVKVSRLDPDDLDIWYALYTETCERNRIFLHDIDSFRAVLEADKATGNSVRTEILAAEKEGVPLAAMFLVYSCNRATYLFGASSSKSRNWMGTYALQWEAIRRAKEQGCLTYDMFGISPRRDPSHPLYGLYRFKTGFGGEIFHRMGCWDYPFDHDSYEKYLSLEMRSQGYHLNS